MATDNKQDFGKIRQEATEDLFDRSAEYSKKQDKPEDEIRDHLKTPGEELFLQNIQQGSGSGAEEDIVKGIDQTGADSNAYVMGDTSPEVSSDHHADIAAAGHSDEPSTQQNTASSPIESSRGTAEEETTLHSGKSARESRESQAEQASEVAQDPTIPAASKMEAVEVAGQEPADLAQQTVNSAPTDITLSSTDIAENAEPGSVVAMLEAVDPDSGDTFNFSLIDDPSGFFEISGNQLVVRDGADLNFESAQIHELTIQVTDTFGNAFTKEFSIDVLDINEGPVIDSDISAESVEGGSRISGAITATDEDFGAVLTFSVSEGGESPAGFELNTDGSYSFDPTVGAYNHLNVGDSTMLTIPVTVTDDQGGTDTAQIQITVKGTNDGPVAVADVAETI